MSESAQPQIDLEQTLRLMDVADEIRRQHRRVHEHLELSDRERIKEHLLQRYEGMGHEADPSLLDEAIDIVLAQQYRFKKPSRGLSLRLAKIYVRRGTLSRRIGIPIAIAIGLLAVGGVAQKAREGSRIAREERLAERKVAVFYTRHRELRARSEALAANPGRERLASTERRELDDQMQTATSRLDRAGEFLARYAPLGTAEEYVTRSNYTEVNGQSGDVARDLDAADALLQEAEAILQHVTSVQELIARANTLQRNIRATTRNEEALSQAERHFGAATRYAQAEDLERLRESVAALSNLEVGLNQEYTLRIVRGRERDGVRHYLIVQAVDAGGTVLKMRIRNEETGTVDEVTEWGERVSRQVYDRVAADYSADNVIDDNVFGVKRRGDLEAERRYESLGQITKY